MLTFSVAVKNGCTSIIYLYIVQFNSFAMKKFIYLVGLFSLLLTSCALTPQKKAEDLIEAYVKSCLYVPESYENVGTSLDSAFTPLCDPAFHETFGKLMEMTAKIEGLDNQIHDEEREISSALSTMSIYSSIYSAHDKFKYNQAKKEKEEHEGVLKELTAKKDKLVERGKGLFKEILTRMEEKPRFIGYQSMHRYRAANNSGYKSLSDYFFVFDPEISRIILVYDTSSDDYKKFEDFVKGYYEKKEME